MFRYSCSRLPNHPVVKEGFVTTAAHREKGSGTPGFCVREGAASMLLFRRREKWSCRCEPGCRRSRIRPSARGLPCLIPALPLLEGYDPLQILGDEHTFALLFDVFWPVVRPLDGLILSGGGDVSACLYGKPPHPQAETPDLWRDVWERYLALLSWLLCLPTLGICRGMQLMNVALGGTIYQDLPVQWPKDRPKLVRHRARGRVSSSNWITHPVQLVRPDSRLALAVKGRGELGRPVLDAVLSMHHQAVEMLAPGLEVSAAAPDGVIEAFEDVSPSRWWVAMQFHPEWSTHLSWVMGLFTTFVDASRAYTLRTCFPLLGRRCSRLISMHLTKRIHAAS